jgi:hypothetical protein
MRRGGREKPKRFFEKNKGKPGMEGQETQRCVVAFETEARRNAAS